MTPAQRGARDRSIRLARMETDQQADFLVRRFAKVSAATDKTAAINDLRVGIARLLFYQRTRGEALERERSRAAARRRRHG